MPESRHHLVQIRSALADDEERRAFQRVFRAMTDDRRAALAAVDPEVTAARFRADLWRDEQGTLVSIGERGIRVGSILTPIDAHKLIIRATP